LLTIRGAKGQKIKRKGQDLSSDPEPNMHTCSRDWVLKCIDKTPAGDDRPMARDNHLADEITCVLAYA
jgi:hypothetical protein